MAYWWISVLLLTFLQLANCLPIISFNKGDNDQNIFFGSIRSMNVGKNKVLINKTYYDTKDLFDYAIEFTLMKHNRNYFKQILDKNIMIISNLQQDQETSVNPIDSNNNNHLTDIFIKFKSQILLLNQIYKISICCNDHNVVGFTLNLNAKKYKALIMPTDSQSIEVYYLEDEKTIKIKSNSIAIPYYSLNRKDLDNTERLDHKKFDQEDSYYLNSLIISDIVTKNGGKWNNLFIKLEICPSMSFIIFRFQD